MGNYIQDENENENICLKICQLCRQNRTLANKSKMLIYPKIHRLTFSNIFILLILFFTITSNAYVLTHEGPTQTHLYKRIVGRQRRDIQREILSLLGLSHRPRPNTVRGFEKTSAPLYMLGLYSTTSHLDSVNTRYNLATNKPFFQRKDRPQNDQPYFDQVATNRYPGGSSYDSQGGNHFPGEASRDNIQQYMSASGFRTNEVGRFESENAIPEYDGVVSNDVERRLIDQSDLVISFINTKQQKGLDENYSKQTKEMIKRQKSFHFDVRQIPTDSEPTSTKFRLYKDVSDRTLGNSSLRVGVYHTTVNEQGSADLRLIGTRLVSAEQEGWLVYDVNDALREWCQYRRGSLGLKVSVETLNGRNVKSHKGGIVGRKGDPTKQAFLVAFFTHDEQTIRPPRRYQRSISEDEEMEEELDEEEGFDDEEEEDGEEYDDVTEEDDIDMSLSNATLVETSEEEGAVNEVELEAEDDVTITSPNETITRAPVRRTTEAERGQTNKRRAKGNRKKKGRRKNKKKNRSRKKKYSGPCHMESLFVNFEDIGWQDWIMAPLGYSAYQCLGECDFPLNPPMNATNHAIVQSLVHLVKLFDKLPKPCCVPSKLDEMSVLYYNDNSTVVYKKYKHMIARACGCS